jgi:hypothetical protein
MVLSRGEMRLLQRLSAVVFVQRPLPVREGILWSHVEILFFLGPGSSPMGSIGRYGYRES